MSKVPLSDLVNLQNETSAVSLINVNSHDIETGFENTLSRDGTQPNSMNASLDMNSNRILNLPSPINPSEPVRLGDVNVNEIVVTKSRQVSNRATAILTEIPLSVDIIETLGYSVPGDQGGASYKRISDPGSSSPAYFQSADGQWWGLAESILKPEMFGATSAVYGTVAASVPNSTTAFNNAVDYLTNNGGGILQLGHGVYKTTTGVILSTTGCYVEGSGERSTCLILEPTGGGHAAIDVNPGGSSGLFYTGIKDLSIGSSNTTLAKVGLRLNDVSRFTAENITISTYPQDGTLFRGNTSIGIHTNGRDTSDLFNTTVYAELPLKISKNPNSVISMDSFHFHNSNWVGHLDTSTTNPLILVDDAVESITNTTFDGTQNWQGGTDGFKWISVLGPSSNAQGLYFFNVKSEQSPEATVGTKGYTFNIQLGARLNGFHVDGFCGGDRNGFTLRNVLQPQISNSVFDPVIANLIGLDVNATLGTLDLKNNTWYTTTAAQITGLTRINWMVSTIPSISTAIPGTAFYSTDLSTHFQDVATTTVNNVGLSTTGATSAVGLAGGKIATFNNTLTFSGTDGSTVNFGTGGTPVYTSGLGTGVATFLATPTSANLAASVTNETGTGSLVFSNSPALVTPTGIVKGDVGLGNVDNTSDATKNAASVTLTNKTITAPVISTISNTGTLTLPTSTDTLVGRATTDTFTNKTYDTAGTGNSFSINGVSATANTGTGSVVRATSPTLTTPALGTPSAVVLTNATGTASSLTAGTVTTNANLTGPITSSGNATSIASQTGTGTKFVVDTSPTLVTPVLGVATATTINGVTLDNNAWTAYTPSFTSSTGTATTSGRYKLIGKSCLYSIAFTFTSAITGNVSLGLPFTATSAVAQGVSGRELVTSGKIVAGDIASGASVIENIRFYDNTTLTANTSSFVINGVYEIT